MAIILKLYETTSQTMEKNSSDRYEMELYYDFASYPFGFTEKTPDSGMKLCVNY